MVRSIRFLHDLSMFALSAPDLATNNLLMLSIITYTCNCDIKYFFRKLCHFKNGITNAHEPELKVA